MELHLGQVAQQQYTTMSIKQDYSDQWTVTRYHSETGTSCWTL